MKDKNLFNLEAEEMILGLSILDKEKAIDLVGKLDRNVFWDEKHQTIFSGIKDLVGESRHVDVVTLSNHLDDQDELEKAGDRIYIESLVEDLEQDEGFEEYIQIVKDKFKRRKLEELFRTCRKQVFDPEISADTILDQVETEAMEIDSLENTNIVQVREGSADVIEEIERLKESDDKVSGVPSFYPKLDELLAGFHEGDFVVLGARPGMGKSRMCVNMMRRMAINDIPVAMFSMEMTTQRLIQDLLIIESQVDAQNARRGFLNDQDIEDLKEAKRRIDQAPIFIDDTPALSVSQMRSKLRRLVRDQDLGAAYLDYLQLMTAGSARSREQEIATISRNLKSMAKEFRIPIIALAQLNRKPENEGGQYNKPRLSHLRESGQIEQDIDVAAFLWRGDYYDIQKYDSGPLQGLSTEGITEFIVAKQRNGPLDTVYFTFSPETLTFEQFEIGEEQRQAEQIEEDEEQDPELPF